MKIGIVGSGRIGGTIGTLWAHAGHEVLFSSRNPEHLADLVAAAGANASSGTPEEALAFGEVVLLSIPFGAIAAFGEAHRALLAGRIVLDTSNPNPTRDGAVAQQVLRSGRGTGAYLGEWLAGAHVVRAFNTVWDGTLRKEAHRAEPRVGIPLASDDEEALGVAAGLVADAGFDPVVVGRLDEARRFDVGTPVYDTGLSGPDVRTILEREEQAIARGDER